MKSSSRIVLVSACLWVLLPAAVVAQPATQDEAVEFEWRVKDRFRLFNKASQSARDRVDRLLDTIAENPELPLEARYDQFLDLLRDDGGPQGHTWELRRSNYNPAGEDVGRTSGRYAPGYLYPEQYEIEVRAVSDDEGTCRYSSAVMDTSGPCSSWTTLAVPPGNGLVLDRGASGAIMVLDSNGHATSVRYEFDDVLIVALGDSFISGEGNPDRPSSFRDLDPDKIFERPSWGSKVELGEHLLKEAEWWDEPCHRSLLSWPVLASIAYAARSEQQAVSLVHLGCSGAVVGDLVEYGETDLPGGGQETESQLALLDRLLLRPSSAWKQRTVDRTLLSIGGNDIGFVGVLSSLALPPNGYTLGPSVARYIGKEASAVCPYINSGRPISRLCSSQTSAEARFPALDDGYSKLALSLREIGIEPSAVFQAQYPNPLVCADYVPCDNNPENDAENPSARPEWNGFEALMGIFPRIGRGFRFRTWNFELRYDREDSIDEGENVGSSGLLYPARPSIYCDRTPEPTDSEVCQALYVHWRLNESVRDSGFRQIAGHLDSILGHGLAEPFPPFGLGIPLSANGKWIGGLSPRDFDPYKRAESGRWFRLPNDSVLTQFQFYGDERHFHHGTVHPTYRSHLEYAEAALREALLQD